MVQGGSAAHACVVLSVMLSLEGCYVSGAASNHLVSSCCFQHGIVQCCKGILNATAVGLVTEGAALTFLNGL